jgi:enamine deaminase RidA (YjgF/YER057c/UK114 family)
MSERPTPHVLVNPASQPRPVGFSHAVTASAGRLVFLAGQGPLDPDGTIRQTGLVGQFDLSCANLIQVLAAAGGRPEHLAWLQIFVRSASRYREAQKEIGAAYRRHFGRHYPAMALFEVAAFYDPAALLELMGIAVIPEPMQSKV